MSNSELNLIQASAVGDTRGSPARSPRCQCTSPACARASKASSTASGAIPSVSAIPAAEAE
ncbi:hypothetical protein ACFFX0_32360 [Citricoccus parietis]|uniref:Uncharacterized protein n=1 Tax=Citricoccus parietis TaxID=592307 RepID=A0ABV5G9P8_9MICC